MCLEISFLEDKYHWRYLSPWEEEEEEEEKKKKRKLVSASRLSGVAWKGRGENNLSIAQERKNDEKKNLIQEYVSPAYSSGSCFESECMSFPSSNSC